MPSDGKWQSRIAALLPVAGWVRADSVSFKLVFCQLTRLTRYTCSLRETQLLNQVRGEGSKEKNEKRKIS